MSALYGLIPLIGLAACAASVEYTPKPVPEPTAGAIPAWVTEQGVVVGADPYTQVERQEAFFGLTLASMGVLPIQVFIRNDRNGAILVRPYEMVLLLPDGRAIAPVGAAAAVARGMGAPVQFTRGALWFERGVTSRILKDTGHNMASTGLELVTVVEDYRYLSALATQRELHRQLFADYRAKELGEVTLKDGESTYGFVYFILSPRTMAPTGVTLAMRMIDIESAIATLVAVPLSNLDLRGKDRETANKR